MNKPKIFIGPMSKNIVDAIIDYTNENNMNIGIIPSRRQIELTGGYVNNWTTKDFCEYVRNKSNNILLVRDHCGPEQGYTSDNGLESFDEDCKYFDVIHVDVWKKYPNYKDGLKSTIDFIKRGYMNNPNLYYEIGTEESIRPFTNNDLDNLLTDLKSSLTEEEFKQIKYCVVQSGTALRGNKNIGDYNSTRLSDMLEVVNKWGLISKEHNGDYLEDLVFSNKFRNSLDSINIAPEFGQIETKVILNEIGDDKQLFEEFYQICYESKRWVKWVPKGFEAHNNKEEIINISRHYVLSEPRFLNIKEKLSKDIDTKIQNKIKERINKMVDLSKSDNRLTLDRYFKWFENKDIVNLKKLFSDDITLQDWNINKVGLDQVVEANIDIFNSVDTIKVKVNEIYSDDNNNGYACDITITINSSEVLDVVDLITFNEKGKIYKVRAYKK